eukprot:9090827-Alexandrium_andersonii.AAC.1
MLELPVDLTAEQRRSIVSDFERGRSHLVYVLTCKLSHWHTLPWSICGLVHHDQQRARDQWELICDRTAPGDIANVPNKTVQRLFSEPCLQQAELWTGGSDIMSEECKDFCAVLAPLAYLYTAERAVEGQHAKTKRSTQAAPSHSVTYVSLLLRLPEMRQFLLQEPDFVKDLACASSHCRSYSKAMHALGMWQHPAR